MAVVLAESAGDLLVEDGGRLLFLHRGSAAVIARFVLAILVLITGVNAVVQLVSGSLAAGAAIGGVAIVAAIGLAFAIRAVRAAREPPRAGERATLVLDTARRVLLDGDGRDLARLDEVRFEPVGQLTSSSKALACRWPGGSAVVYRGNPFSGGIGEVQDILRARGLAA